MRGEPQVKIGIGLPNPVPNIPGNLMVDWAQRAEAVGFSGLVTIDRIAYPSYDSLTSLAAAAGATKRISLMTNILLAPIYTPVLLAKAAASIDQISSGRFSLGLAAGGRPDDYEVAGRDFRRRGREFDNALDVMHRVWRGEPLTPNSAPASPTPTHDQRVPILFGGTHQKTVERVTTWGAGWTAGGSQAAPPGRSPREYAAPGRQLGVAESLGSPHLPTFRWATRRRRRRVGTCWTITASSAISRARSPSLPIDRFPRCVMR
jgi:alkanesulfonate monooxygenase SsuD/methylene tetrahydromethanopterin reductase-like flavin-dependent oxidoreductase (luciferase family)